MVDKHAISKRPGISVVMITLDNNLAGVVSDAEARLLKSVPGLTFQMFAACDWKRDNRKLDTCKAAIAKADFILCSMLFIEEHINAIRPALLARRDKCDAIVCVMSATEVVKLTRLGRFDMEKPESAPMAFLKKLRGSGDKSKSGASQMRMLRRLPKILKYIPGPAQDVRAYFLTMQYLLAGSQDNIVNMVAFLIDKYASDGRKDLYGALKIEAPVEYPDLGVYHPRMTPLISEATSELPLSRSKKPTIGLLILRSYLLSGDTAHYDGVISALESKGLRVIPAFASGLDSRPAIEKFHKKDGKPIIDGLVSLTGFSLVGGPAYNDSDAAAEILGTLDVPYLAAHALEFQTLNEWGAGTRGLSPVESTIMVAIPELDGATNPMVYGGRVSVGACSGCSRHCNFENVADRSMHACVERAEMLAARVAKLIALKKTKASDRKLAITLFNFPPNGGGVGTAAFMAVYESLFNTLHRLKDEGYSLQVPQNVETLKAMLLEGNTQKYGSDANVAALVDTQVHVAREVRLAEIEKQWGPAPGRHQTDGRNIQIFGIELGNVFIGVQPAFGYEGDPMRLLFEGGFAPTHAFAAFYRYLREDFGAHAVLHFGTHGALEFMPGKQTGMSGDCWSDYLIDDLPNIYFYAANNPSEGTIAKRRSAATIVSYMTPSVTSAGLYNELVDLKETIERWRQTPPNEMEKRLRLAEAITSLATAMEMADEDGSILDDMGIERVRRQVMDTESALIPHGLHVAGSPPSLEQRTETLRSIAAAVLNAYEPSTIDAVIGDLVNGASVLSIVKTYKASADTNALESLAKINSAMLGSAEMDGLMHALDGGFIAPVAGGDLLRNPEIMPTGRNMHGFDPFRLPSAFAVMDGAKQAELLIERHCADGAPLPETIAMVLWGTDNLKSEGAQLAQVLALIGAKPHFDSYGRLSGADLIPIEELGRPRIDVVATLSGIFRDLLPIQTQMLAKAFLAAASADEPVEKNFIRKHALAYMYEHECDMDTAALRVFSNADGAYGANVNQMIDAGCWDTEDDLADAYERRKCFAYGVSGEPASHAALLTSILKDVDMSYQNLESVELGVTTIDHYFDTLGGIGRAVKRAKGKDTPVYISDQTRGDGVVRTLSEQVALETRTRTLNPKWYEGMLKHGYEGVRQIEAHVTNTLGWSATTGQVDPWVYQKIGETFVLDDKLRRRLSELNPKSSARLASRLLEASDRDYWRPDNATLEALRRAGDELEDRVEGIPFQEGAAA